MMRCTQWLVMDEDVRTNAAQSDLCVFCRRMRQHDTQFAPAVCIVFKDVLIIPRVYNLGVTYTGIECWMFSLHIATIRPLYWVLLATTGESRERYEHFLCTNSRSTHKIDHWHQE